MADRKKAREKALNRLQKLAEKNPSDKILTNVYSIDLDKINE